MSQWRWNVRQNSTRRGSMSLPIQLQSQLYYFKSRILALVAAQVFSVVMVSRLFGISRKTFYKYLIVRNWQISPKILKLLEMRRENASLSSLSNRDSDSGCA